MSLAMIIQRVIKGISRITESEAQQILAVGIRCMWWVNLDPKPLPYVEIPQRLTQRNLDWHQNQYDAADPKENNEKFYLRTPFISTTAGTIERDTFNRTNIMNPAWKEALFFATDAWKADGYLFHCYLLIIGRRAVAHQVFSEELRELNVYTGFSPYQPEGEITAKIVIPPAQIERAEFWSKDGAFAAVKSGRLPTADASRVLLNPLFVRPDDYNNVRDVLK
jgi:hypothetical protein